MLQYNSLGEKISQKIQTDIIVFAEAILGLPLSYHEGQVRWFKRANKTINILRPGNKWGKSLAGGVKHAWHLMLKPLLPQTLTDEEWFGAKYETLNFGPGYEQAREILRMCRDAVEGRILLPEEFSGLINKYTGEPYGNFNKSILKDWAIKDDKSDSKNLPYLEFWNNATMLGRSYSEMGQAFKMKALAYASGDECADVDNLWTFTNGTLLPRMVTVRKPQIDYYGTPQPDGHDYIRMIEMAEEDMKRKDYSFRGMYYVQKGSMYENPFIPKETIKQIESIADPILKKQIIDGEHVEVGDKYFGFTRVQNMVDDKMQLIEEGVPGRRYLTIVDYAGGESAWADYTVIMTIDFTEEPYRIVQFQRFKGGDIAIPIQYKMTEDITMKFGGKGKLVIDSSALGGKNAMAFLSHLNPISANFGPKYKAEILATLKIAMDGGQSKLRKRIRVKNDFGEFQDKNPDWGLIRMPNIPVMVNELQNYRLDDKRLRQDCVMALAMGIHWIEMRRPKKQKKAAQDFDFLGF